VVDKESRHRGDLDASVEPTVLPWDPPLPPRWTIKSTRTAAELAEQGHVDSYKRVGEILHDSNYTPAGQRQDAGGR